MLGHTSFPGDFLGFGRLVKHSQGGVSVPGTHVAGVAPTWARESVTTRLESWPAC